MSNLLKAITHLKNNPEGCFLKIQDENSKTIGTNKIFLKDIPKEDLGNYLKLHLGQQDKDVTLWVEVREMRGVSDKKVGGFPVRIESEKKEVVAQPSTVPTQHQYQQQPQNYGSDFLGSAVQQGNGMMAVSTAQVLEMQRKADKLDDANEKLFDLRKEFSALKKEFDIIDIESRDLKSKLATAEAQKEVAVTQAKTENKGFLESPAFEKLLEKAPEMLGNFAALKAGGMPNYGSESLGAPSNLSETKQGFIEYIKDDLTDEQVNYLGSICHFLPNDDFKNDLKNLVSKYNGQ